MPQPSGQVLVDSGHPLAGFFAYANDSGMWDAQAGAMLTKVGSGAVTSESGANVATSNANTYYTLASSITLSGAFSVGFRCRQTASDSRSMVLGQHTTTTSYIWLNNSGSTRFGGLTIGTNGGTTSTTTWHITRDGTSQPIRLYKNGTLQATLANSGSGALTVSALLKGYSTNTSFDFAGAVEWVHVLPAGKVLNQAEIDSLVADPYQILQAAAGIDAAVAATGAMAWAATGSIDASGVAPVSADVAGPGAMAWAAAGSVSTSIASGTITLTAPAAYRMRQRNVTTNTCSLTIAGTSTATSAIEYRRGTGAWQTLVASHPGGAYSATVTMPTGQGDLQVRHASDTAVTASVFLATVGDTFIAIGQSNNVGAATETVPPVASAFTAIEYDALDVWKPLQEGLTTGTSFSGLSGYGGSYFGALSNRLQANGVPVAFVPAAVGSTRISDWQRNASNPTSTATLYGRALTQWNEFGGGRAAILWQGESDASAGTTKAAYKAGLHNVIDGWWTDTGTPTFLILITNFHANAPMIREAQMEVIAESAHVIGWADGGGAYSGNVHYLTATQINAVADAVYTPFEAAFYPDPLTVDVAGEGSMQWAGLGAISADVFDYVPAVSFVLTTNGITPAANITGIQWAWWDATPPDLSSAPVANGTTSTDADGTVALTITGSTLAVGQVGTMLLMTGDGTPGSGANRAFCAPVEVV